MVEREAMQNTVRSCPCCHSDDVEVVRNDRHGFIALCNECGFAQGASLSHLLAS